MERADQHLNSMEIPIIANRILHNYKRDRSYFEHYSPKFDHQFLVQFEEKVDTIVQLTSQQTLEKEITKADEKIKMIIDHFYPLIAITEDFLHSVPKAAGLPVANFSLNELRDALNKRCIWEIQRSCRKIIDKFELHANKFIDTGFLSIILNDFHLSLEKLKNAESEIADITQLRDMITNEYLIVDNQVEYYIKTILESTPKVFGEKDADKMAEYSIKKLMSQAHFLNDDIQ